MSSTTKIDRKQHKGISNLTKGIEVDNSQVIVHEDHNI